MEHSVVIGSKVKVSLSDSPVFSGTVTDIVDDGKFGRRAEVTRRNGRVVWVDEARIVSVEN